MGTDRTRSVPSDALETETEIEIEIESERNGGWTMYTRRGVPRPSLRRPRGRGIHQAHVEAHV